MAIAPSHQDKEAPTDYALEQLSLGKKDLTLETGCLCVATSIVFIVVLKAELTVLDSLTLLI